MERRTEGRKEGSVTISLRNFVGEGIKKPQNINRQYLRYNIIWGIVFPEYFNQKLFLIVDLYLSPDKLARKIYLSMHTSQTSRAR